VSASDGDLAYGILDSPVGSLLVAGDGCELHRIAFSSESGIRRQSAGWRRDDALFTEAFRQLRAYFAGELTSFTLPLRRAGTAFQNSVWTALCDIPYGETATYGALAARIGRPAACRAVGSANAANPLPIVVPCHRVIGADGSLTGFGGGVPIKRFLLALEQGHARSDGPRDREAGAPR